ncbi:MAG: Cobalt-zinc-cadmium resistance protein CzcA, partial [Alphaproteobacteria bacterium]|nr:Cobalt-zinc-cadmium resistance protein CzcA [Alphaproteobacteria bacterium]
MNIAEAFIRRPTATLLLALGVLMVGVAAYFALPVAPLPQVEFPTIQVDGALPGASAETMATAVASPLERSLSSVPGLTEMTSSSGLGRTQIVLVFDLSKPIDSAAQDVQTAINAALGKLPKSMPDPPSYEKVNPADVTMMSLALTSDTMPMTDLTRLADDIAKQLSRLPGVGLIDFHGDQPPAIRIQLDPDRAAALGLTLGDVRTMVAHQTVNAPKGTISGNDRTIVLNATDQLTEPGGYQAMVVAYRNGAPVRVGDIGTVVAASENIRTGGWINGRPGVVIDIHKQIGFNVVETIAGIRKALPAIKADLPPAASLAIASDRTQTIESSINDIQLTMGITILLVTLVIFAFLRNLRATIIAAMTIPLSIVATFAAMFLLGYSLDNLSLMALTIAVSFVVDDAIVVIENISRHVEQGMGRFEAAIQGSREILFTIISMTSSLIAVFIPILLMGGIIGRLMREFAVTVSVALLISALISLTVTPMLCAYLLEHLPEGPQSAPQRWAGQAFEAMLRAYRRGLDAVLRHPGFMLGLTVVTIALTVGLYIVIPKGFFPQQDTGIIIGVAEAAPDVSFGAMSKSMNEAGRIIRSDPDVSNTYYWTLSTPSTGRFIVSLKRFGRRKSGAAQVMARLRERLARVEGLDVHLQLRQDIQLGGRPSKTQFQYTLQSADLDELSHWAEILKAKFAALPQLQDVSSDAEAATRSATIVIDRTTAARLGISADAVDDVLYDAFGQRQIATMFTQLNQYHVVEEVGPHFSLSTESLSHLYVRSSLTGALVRLSMVARIVEGVSPVAVNHQGTFPSITLSFNIAPGHALGDAVNAIETAGLEAGMPSTVKGSFQGTAKAFQSSLKSQPWLILAALLVVYIVLGILYESAIHPLTIISTLPSAGLGALLALILFGQDLSIMGMIGILLLIGIVKKNAIMMIDFALTAEREGLSPEEAIRQGALLRFRPIMMTTVAALFGALPLAFVAGAGAELRQPLGIAIAGGLIVSQALTLFTTPVIYLWFDRLAHRLSAPRLRP